MKEGRRWHFPVGVALLTIVAPLPIAFLPDRGGAMLYIPYFGWAIIGATLVAGVCSVVARLSPLRLPGAETAHALLLLSAVGLLWYATNRHNQKVLPAYTKAGLQFRSVKDQLAALLPEIKPGTRLIFYNDIFDLWDSHFIPELVYHDRSVRVFSHPKNPRTQDELDAADYVLGYEQQRLVIVKRPNEPFAPPRKFVAPPGFRIEVNASEIRAGKDTLVVRLVNFPGRVMDVLYRLDDRPIQMVTGWPLDDKHQSSVFVGASTQRGTYYYEAIRDPSNCDLREWIPIDLRITVK